jgi:hypothetical protein
MEFLLGLEWEQPTVDLLAQNLVNPKDEELVADLGPQKAQVLVDESALVLDEERVCASAEMLATGQVPLSV